MTTELPRTRRSAKKVKTVASKGPSTTSAASQGGHKRSRADAGLPAEQGAGRAVAPRHEEAQASSALQLLGSVAASATATSSVAGGASTKTPADVLPPGPAAVLQRRGTSPASLPTRAQVRELIQHMAQVVSKGTDPMGAFQPAQRQQLVAHSAAAAATLEAAAKLQQEQGEAEPGDATTALALQAAHCLHTEMLARMRQQTHTQHVTMVLARCLHWSLRVLEGAQDMVAAAAAARDETATTTTAHSASHVPRVKLPREPTGVYPLRGGGMNMWTATVQGGGYWYRQEKTKFLAALHRDLQGLSRGLNPLQHPSFGWCFAGQGWVWAEVQGGAPTGRTFWSGPDPDELPDDVTERTFRDFWAPGPTLKCFEPVWAHCPPSTVHVSTLQPQQLVPADDTATSQQASLVCQAVPLTPSSSPDSADPDGRGDVQEELELDMRSGAEALLAAARAASPTGSDGGDTVPYEGEGGDAAAD